MPEDIPEDMPGRMPEDMPDKMPDRMPEDMSDRVPENLPVTKRIHVLVGITRSKAFFFSNGLRKLQSQCSIGNLHVSIIGRKLLRGRVFQPRLNRLLAACALTLVWAPSLSGDFIF